CTLSHEKWLTRRDFLGNLGTGLGSIALACLLTDESRASQPHSTHPLTHSPTHPLTHFVPKARRVVQIFCPGAVSHLDTFEYKPELVRRHGQPLSGESLVTFQGANGN